MSKRSLSFPFLVTALSTGCALAQMVVPTPHKLATTRFGSVVSCHVEENCTVETLNELQVYRLTTPDMMIRVALVPDHRYSRFAISVENRSEIPVHYDATYFRVEAERPSFKRLSFVAPPQEKKSAKAAPQVRLKAAAMTSEDHAHAPGVSPLPERRPARADTIGRWRRPVRT